MCFQEKQARNSMGRYVGYEAEKVSSWKKEEVGWNGCLMVIRKSGLR